MPKTRPQRTPKPSLLIREEQATQTIVKNTKNNAKEKTASARYLRSEQIKGRNYTPGELTPSLPPVTPSLPPLPTHV